MGVSVGGRGVGVKAAAVSVNSATTVYAAEVRTASTSGVGTMGVAGAQAERVNAAANIKVINLIFIRPLLQSTFAKTPAEWRNIIFYLFASFVAVNE